MHRSTSPVLFLLPLLARVSGSTHIGQSLQRHVKRAPELGGVLGGNSLANLVGSGSNNVQEVNVAAPFYSSSTTAQVESCSSQLTPPGNANIQQIGKMKRMYMAGLTPGELTVWQSAMYMTRAAKMCVNDVVSRAMANGGKIEPGVVACYSLGYLDRSTSEFGAHLSIFRLGPLPDTPCDDLQVSLAFTSNRLPSASDFVKTTPPGLLRLSMPAVVRPSQEHVINPVNPHFTGDVLGNEMVMLGSFHLNEAAGNRIWKRNGGVDYAGLAPSGVELLGRGVKGMKVHLVDMSERSVNDDVFTNRPWGIFSRGLATAFGVSTLDASLGTLGSVGQIGTLSSSSGNCVVGSLSASPFFTGSSSTTNSNTGTNGSQSQTNNTSNEGSQTQTSNSGTAHIVSQGSIKNPVNPVLNQGSPETPPLNPGSSETPPLNPGSPETPLNSGSPDNPLSINTTTASNTTSSNNISGQGAAGQGAAFVSSMMISASIQVAAAAVTPASSPLPNSAPIPTALAVAEAASTSTFQLPGRNLEVLPIGLGVFGGVSFVTLVIVGVVTYERRKYRNQFRQRKMREQAGGYGKMVEARV